MFAASDGAIAQSLDGAFRLLKALDQPAGGLTREEVYAKLAAAVQQMQRIKDLAGQVKPAPANQHDYDERMVYYALAVEAATDALVYVDTGAADLRAQAEKNYREAAAMPAAWAKSAP
jgi:hypothetical protein